MIDDGFGHWLAGFIDGEGCFRVHKSKGGDYYACHFTLKLRDDDGPILHAIVERTGVGYIKPDLVRGKSQPCLVWVVGSKADCLKLIPILDRYPLRAKKSRDYAIWREAVMHWVAMRRGNRWHGPRDWSQMIEYKTAIEAARAYA